MHTLHMRVKWVGLAIAMVAWLGLGVLIEVAAQEAAAAETKGWNRIKDTNDLAEFRAYLQRYPNGIFGPLAQMKMEELEYVQRVEDARMRAKKYGPQVLVPEGEFTMGSNDGDSDEKPVHSVHLDAFLIDVYEVTASRYAIFINATGHNKPKDSSDGDHPVRGVSWHDAVAYCQWAGKRLPTEAEWEKAARGTDGRKYPWGNEAPTPKLADYGAGDLMLVGVYEAGVSPYGVYDMAGNVWEWVADWYGDDYYENSSSRSPDGPSSGTYRVLRGGSWNYTPGYTRSANRVRYAPEDRNSRHGFRCSKDVERQ